MSGDITAIEKIQMPLTGECRLPGDKSISIRLAILGSFAPGTYVRNMSVSPLVETVLDGMSVIGAGVNRDKLGVVGFSGFPNGVLSGNLHCGSSATFMRLITGLLSGIDGEWLISGDEQLTRRPMDRVAVPLNLMGADVSSSEGFPPLKVKGHSLKGIEYVLPVSSAQVKSAILLAGLNADGETKVLESRKTRDHTERIMSALGADIRIANLDTGDYAACVSGPVTLTAADFMVPGDISSGANMIALATLVHGSSVIFRDLLLNPTRTGFLDHLTRMGAGIEIIKLDDTGFEPVGDVRVEFTGRLRNVPIGEDMVPGMIDELPLLAMIGAFSESIFEMSGGADLRLKESDRIQSTAFNLRGMGIDVEESEDGLRFEGKENLKPCTFDSYGDHRIALAGVVAGSVIGGCSIENEESAGLSFPGFKAQVNALTRRE